MAKKKVERQMYCVTRGIETADVRFEADEIVSETELAVFPQDTLRLWVLRGVLVPVEDEPEVDDGQTG